MGVLAFGAAANANTLTVDFGGVAGGTLTGTNVGENNEKVLGDLINIATMTIQDDTGTTIYDVNGGILTFDTTAGLGSGGSFQMVITGGVDVLDIAGGTTLFEGSFTSWTFTDGIPDLTPSVFVGNGSGGVGDAVIGKTVSEGDNPFIFTGFSLESANNNVLSTDFLMTATGTRTPEVPIPAAAWLFGSGLLGLMGVARRKA